MKTNFKVRPSALVAFAALATVGALSGPALSAPIMPSAQAIHGMATQVQVNGEDRWVPRRRTRQETGRDQSGGQRFDDGNERMERRGMTARRGSGERGSGYSDRRRHENGGRFVYDERRYGSRYSYRHGSYRHYHDGYYYASPWWLGAGVGAIVGSAVAASQGSDVGHAEWCASRYRSYDHRTNTFIGRGGRRYVCVIQ